jgi:hypothetical protein
MKPKVSIQSAFIMNESSEAELRKRTYRARIITNVSSMNQSRRLVEIIFIVRDQRFQWSHFVFFKKGF